MYLASPRRTSKFGVIPGSITVIEQQHVISMATWISDIVSAMSNLGGTAHYSELYNELKRIRPGPLPSAWKKIVQRQIQDHAGKSLGFKSKPLFYSVGGLGSGKWGLLPESSIVSPAHVSEAQPPFLDDTEVATSKQRNAAWSRDELILALDLYMSHRKDPLSKNSFEVKELSNCLNKLNALLEQVSSESFRNTNGVYMKLMNFRRFDPEYIAAGKVGLVRGNKDEEVVWKEFSSDPEHLKKLANAIRQLLEKSFEFEFTATDELGIHEAVEGRILSRVHRYRERNRKIVDERKKLALKTLGCLKCEACGFDFSAVYGDAGDGLIDVHHTKPVHTLAEGEKTRLEDLALLCSNCHRVVHSSRKWLSVEEVRSAFNHNRVGTS